MKYPRALSILRIHLQRAPILQRWQGSGGIFQRQCMVSMRADHSLGYRLAPGRPEPQVCSHCTHTKRRPTDGRIKEIISRMRHGILELRAILYIQTISRIRKLAVKRDETTCPKLHGQGKKITKNSDSSCSYFFYYDKYQLPIFWSYSDSHYSSTGIIWFKQITG